MHLLDASYAQVIAIARRRGALMADQVASSHRRPCAKLRVMAVIAIAEMFGISGQR